MLNEREQARTGPRAMKDVGSLEWCWQTVDFLKDSLRHVDEQWRQAEAVLDELDRAQAWKVIPPGKPYGSYTKMLKAETGLDKTTIEKHIRDARLTSAGGDRRSDQFQSNNVTLNLDRGNSQTYTVRRLKRDRPDLAERVERREISANAAAIEAGFRSKTISVPVGRPERIAASLRKWMSREARARLAELLTQDDSQD